MKQLIKNLLGQADEPKRNFLQTPGTTHPHTNQVDRTARNENFDPALKHFSKGFRPGELKQKYADVQAKWKDTRQLAIEEVLGIIAESEWAEHLVLRGSVSMREWYGNRAREPRDIDFVFQPYKVKIDDFHFNKLYHFLRREILNQATQREATYELIAQKTSTDSIWTYERADGRRLSIPWKREGVPGGEVQIDIVFGEKLPELPVDLIIPTVSGRYQFQSASKELSLAWKILWLASDYHPQGKDLYDAVLLAEDPSVELSVDTLRTVLGIGSGDYGGNLPGLFGPQTHVSLNDEWNHFTNEYPEFSYTPEELIGRLREALTPQLLELGISLP